MTNPGGGASRKRGAAAALVLATTLGLGACADRAAVELTDTFSPPPRGWLGHGSAAMGTKCRVWFDGIADSRADQHDMGTIAYRMVHSNDTVAYLRSGLAELRRDPRLMLLDKKDDGALAVHIELLKAYMFSQATDKMTNIVLRVRFTGPGGAAWQATYRGGDHAVNWVSGEDETQGAFDRATADVLDQLDAGIVEHCVS